MLLLRIIDDFAFKIEYLFKQPIVDRKNRLLFGQANLFSKESFIIRVL